MVLSATDAARVVALIEDGRSQRYVARFLGLQYKEWSNGIERLGCILEDLVLGENVQHRPLMIVLLS